MEELQPVPERIEGIKALPSLDSGVPVGHIPSSRQTFGEGLQVIPHERRMGYAGWDKIGFDSAMHFDGAEHKPGTADGSQLRRLVDRGKSQKPAVVLPSAIFASGGDGELNVVDPLQRIPRITVTTFPINSTPSVNTIGS